jgi:branched-chain amino acid transport system ATP-binding protein
MLEIQQLQVFRGQLPVLSNLTLSVAKNEIVAILGANGSGKSSLFEAIAQQIPWGGEMHFEGKSLKNVATWTLAEMGIAIVPEGRRLFGEMTVFENLQMGAFCSHARIGLDKNLKKVYTIFPLLRIRKDQVASTLSGGEQQMLAISRALMSDPRLILIDEMSIGLSPRVASELFEKVASLAADGLSVLLTEQNASLSLQYAQRAYVLSGGKIAASGSSSDLKKDGLVQQAYLGTKPASAITPPRLEVVELRENHIPFINSYWDNSSEPFLRAMGVDPTKLGPSSARTEKLREIIATPDRKKTTCSLVWEVNGSPIGYTTLKRIQFGQHADVHLHIWDESSRGKGYGTYLFSRSLKIFFDRFQLTKILCEPAATNRSSNSVLRKVGARFIQNIRLIPSEICFEIESAQYEITRQIVEHANTSISHPAS